MPPNFPNGNYKSKIKLDLNKLKNGQTQNVKVDLTKVNVKTLASQIGVLSEDVKLYMEPVILKMYFASNDRTTNLLKKDDVDMGATTSETGEGEPVGEGEPGFSDAELSKTLIKKHKLKFL